jgi:hypothetical protein
MFPGARPLVVARLVADRTHDHVGELLVKASTLTTSTDRDFEPAWPVNGTFTTTTWPRL